MLIDFRKALDMTLNLKLAFGAWDTRKHNGVKSRLINAEQQSDASLFSKGRASVGTQLFSTHFLLPRSGRGGNQKMHLCFSNIVWLVGFWEENGWWFITKCVFGLRFFFINLSLGTQVPLESAVQGQELHCKRFLTFRKLHNDKHDSSSSQLSQKLNFYAVLFKEPNEIGVFSKENVLMFL